MPGTAGGRLTVVVGFATRRYLQGCESAYTHVAACCTAGSPTNDRFFNCSTGQASKYDGPQFMGYDCARATDSHRGAHAAAAASGWAGSPAHPPRTHR